MVFGRLIRSIGLGRAQAKEEEPRQSDTTSPSLEDSITSSTARPASPSSSRGDTTDTGDEASEQCSVKSSNFVNGIQTDEVYSKITFLQFRAVVDEQCGGEELRAMPDPLAYSSRPTIELDRTPSPPSPKSTPSDAQVDAAPKTPSANSWAAAMQSKRSVADPEADDGAVNRKACSILNKLTVEKFDSLFEQLATCGIKKVEHLEMLMGEVFNKATTQHHFIPMYADLCVRLEKDDRTSSVVGADGTQHSFRRMLLNQCQLSFEKLLQPGEMDTKSKDLDTDEEVALKRKQQALGNIKLMGQLLVHGIVTSKLLVECSETLLECRDTCPEALESLAALLTVAGKQFDTENWQYHPRLLEVFACMRRLSKDKSTQARVKFLLRDVLDVRDAGWSHCTYKATLATAPMKLADVAESANNEGKYMSLEDQIETDTLLAGLMGLSKAANARKDAAPLGASLMQSKSKPWHKNKQQQHFGSDKEASAPPQNEAKGKKGQSQAKTKGGSTPPVAFDVVTFRRSLAAVLVDLSSDRDVPAAVRRIRVLDVPLEHQAKEFADIITRIVEEKRGPIRRCALAFTAGLGAADEQSAFDRNACLDGIGLFFSEVYPGLIGEIPRLVAITTSELVPTLRNVFPSAELDRRLPAAFAAD